MLEMDIYYGSSAYRNDFNPTNALYLINSGEKIFTRVYGIPILLNSSFFRENRSELNELGQYVLDSIPPVQKN